MATKDELILAWGDPQPVLNGGHVRLVDVMGDDTSIVQAARISYGAGTKTVREDRGLIRYMMRYQHWTPFEMCVIKLHVKAPIEVARQWFRHRTASYNEFSTRYSQVESAPYATEPGDWRMQSKTNKQGIGGRFHKVHGHELSEIEFDALATAKDAYDTLTEQGVAREQARRVLPLATWTEFYVTMNLRNLLHFIGLRADSHAQIEIREYASIIWQIAREWCPLAVEAFDDYHALRGGESFSKMEMNVLHHLLAGWGITEDPELYGMSKREWREFWKKLGPEAITRHRAPAIIDLGGRFPTPGGRYESDGEQSGEAIRDYLIDQIRQNKPRQSSVSLDGAYGWPSSCLEEVFGGLVRHRPDMVDWIADIRSEEPRHYQKAETFMREASQRLRESNPSLEGM